MMRKKTQVKKEPVFNEEPLAKVPRVINQPCAGSMSPDSGCGDYSSDGNVSSPGDPQPPVSTPATPNSSSSQLDMSTMIEQAFAHSVGEIPASEKEQNEAPISPLSSDLGSTDLDLFDQLDLSTELNQCAPPWEELDIDIEPSFTSITPFLSL